MVLAGSSVHNSVLEFEKSEVMVGLRLCDFSSADGPPCPHMLNQVLGQQQVGGRGRHLSRADLRHLTRGLAAVMM